MAVPTRDDSAAVDEPAEPTADATITAHRTSPERTVFTEVGNRDAWIATDLTVDPDC